MPLEIKNGIILEIDDNLKKGKFMKKQLKTYSVDGFLECERLRTFILLITVGGFLGAYTFTVKGGVFCNAQTANFVMLAVQLGKMNWARALYYLIPITAYLLGAVISEFLPKRVNKFEIVRWDTLFIAFEMLSLLALGFVPDDAPPQICQVSINFIASMQYNTFRQAKKVPMATTFCTNHLRQVGVNLVKAATKKDKSAAMRLKMHFAMLIAFVAGAVISTFLCVRFGGKAIWFAEILLLIVFIDLLRADLIYEKDQINTVPHGH